MDSLTKVFDYKKQKDDIDYIVEVIREGEEKIGRDSIKEKGN